MKRFARIVVAFVAAVLVAEVLAASASTQFVLYRLSVLGIPVPAGDRLSMTLHDIAGMLPLYGLVIGVAFVIALPVAAWLSRRAPRLRLALFALAGAVGIVTAILVLQASFDIMPIAGARSVSGLVAQGLAGALGGLTAAMLMPDRHPSGTAAG